MQNVLVLLIENVPLESNQLSGEEFWILLNVGCYLSISQLIPIQTLNDCDQHVVCITV